MDNQPSEHLSPEETRARLARLLQEKAGTLKLAPTSSSQERLWFVGQLLSGESINITQRIRMTGELDVAALQKSLDAIVQRHESLRTTIMTVGGEPMQAIAAALSVPVLITDLEHFPPEAREAEAQRLAEEESGYPFDLARGPLFRVRLLRLAPARHWLILNIHHIIADGWSMGVLVGELATLYQSYTQGQAPALPDLPMQYADFARWQRQRLGSEEFRAHLAYWMEKLADLASPPNFLPESVRPARRSLAGAELSLTFPEALGETLQTLSQQEQCTLFMTLLAGFVVLLYRYDGQPDVCIATLIANRSFRPIEPLIGFFINFLALRVNAGGNPGFRELLQQVRTVTLEAYAHQDMPIDQVVETWQRRYQSRMPLFRTLLVLQNAPLPTLDLPGLELDISRPAQAQNADMDLALFLTLKGQELTGHVQYSTDLWDEADMRRIMRHYQSLLQAAVAAPDTPIEALAWLTDEEARQVIVEFNRAASLNAEGATFEKLFEGQAARTPQAEAVSFAGESLTYTALNRRANQLAHYLRSLGVKPEVRVGIAISRSPEMIVALLGVLKAGGGYVPLDPAYPPERLATMMEESGVEVLLTTVRDRFPIRDAPHTVYLDGPARDEIARQSETNPPNNATAQNLAYVIFTSGSTGKPKGVMIPRAALANYALSAQQRFGITPADRVLQFATLNFDTAVEEIYPALLSGATLVLRAGDVLELPENFLDACQRERISVLSLPTAYWHTLVSDQAAEGLTWPASLRLVVIGGERALPEMFQRWNEAQARGDIAAATRLFNNYGPTEATVVATEAELTPGSAIVIGKPIHNVRCYILDHALRPAPVGAPGELYIAGRNLARGYLNHPAQTAAVFVPDPFSDEPGARMYRTGDQARYRADGAIEFLGRMDNQVKVRGFRVELDEIQAIFNRHPAVQEAVVVALADAQVPGSRQPVAYVVPKQATDGLAAELRAYAQQQLPDYMIPAVIVPLSAFPLTPAGKIDRKALPLPEEQSAGEEYTSPEGPVEEKLAEIWGQALNRKRIGAYDNFFDLGGHSLLATRVIYTINQAFHIKLSVRALFEEPTLAGLALVIEEMLLDELDAERLH